MPSCASTTAVLAKQETNLFNGTDMPHRQTKPGPDIAFDLPRSSLYPERSFPDSDFSMGAIRNAGGRVTTDVNEAL